MKPSSEPRTWLEMPVAPAINPDDPPQPLYPIYGSAVLIYESDKVTVAVQDPETTAAILLHPNVRVLNFEEVVSLLRRLDVGSAEQTWHFGDAVDGDQARRFGLGDMVAWITSRLGFQECLACQRRHRLLNRVSIWGWWRRQ